MTAHSTQSVRCGICPKACRIPPGFSGECRVRINVAGTLHAATYGRPCAVHVDPIEKKPLFHYFPGQPILSLGTSGCNLHCKNCQNAELSQGDPEELRSYDLPPEALPALARKHTCAHVAYTYNEPIVSYEYTRDCCQTVHQAGLRNVLVTAGYINEKPLAALLPHVDAANVDIKGFSDQFYREVCDASLTPVLRSVVMMHQAGVHLEITNLVIPTLNESDEMLEGLCGWLMEHLGSDVPLHFSRFFPSFKMKHLPPTPVATLLRARELAQKAGLRYVYIGNVEMPDGEDTRCPKCHQVIIQRQRYVVLANRITANGLCETCGEKIYGVWS